jgi:hypothetical protein
MNLELTPEQEALFAEYQEKWFDIVFSTERIDREKAKEAVKAAYATIGKTEPEIFFCDSPLAVFNLLLDKFDLLVQKLWNLQESLPKEAEPIIPMEGFRRAQRSEILYEKLWFLDACGIQIYLIVGGIFWDELLGQRKWELQYKFENLYTQLSNHLHLHLYSQDSWKSYFQQGYKGGRLVDAIRRLILFAAFRPDKLGEIVSQIDFSLSVNNQIYNQEKWEILQGLIKNCGWFIPLEGIAIICDRPIQIYFDKENNLHAETKPAIIYPDGFSLYSYHGVYIPEIYGKLFHHQLVEVILDEKMPTFSKQKLLPFMEEELTALATNVNTSSDSLLKLEEFKSVKIKQALAANPNSPIELLLRLSKDFPEQVLNNPVLPLLLLENLAVDIFANFPESFLLELVNNPQTSQELLGILVSSKHPQIAQSAKLHVNWAGEMSQGWHESVLEFIHNTPIEEQDLRYLHKLAKYELIPEKVLPYIPANQQGEKLLEAIAHTTKNPHTLEYLAINSNQYNNNQSIISAVLFNAKTPQNVFKELFNSGQCYRELALNHNTHLKILEQLFKSSDDNVRSALAGNPRCPQSILEELFSLGKYYRELAGNPNTPPIIVEQLLKSSDNNVRSVLSRNPNISIENLKQLVTNIDTYSRMLLASNINTPESLLEQLAKDYYSFIREDVAKNLSTPVRILKDLARDPEEKVRFSITQNPNTPANALLEAIASISDSLINNIDKQLAHLNCSKFATPFVIWKSAANPRIPIDFLEQWLKSGDIRFLIPTAKNPNTPDSSLLKLARDENPLVRYSVAQNSNLSVNILEVLAQDEERDIRYNVASHPNTPVSLLEELAKDKGVVWNVARNPNTPVNLLEKLAQVNVYCWTNPNTPISLFEQCLDKVIGDPHGLRIAVVEAYLERNPSGLPTVLEKCLNHATFSLSRFFLLLNPATPATALVANSCSTAWLERYAIAQHANTPIETLKILANDVNCIVRATAKDSLKGR